MVIRSLKGRVERVSHLWPNVLGAYGEDLIISDNEKYYNYE